MTIIYMTPDGETLNQGIANQLSMKGNLIVLCGHYKGVDQRVRDQFITKEISIGDYVLSGGELGAAVLCDAIIRLIPGVLGNETSALTDSFQDGLLAPPIYTKPRDYKGWKVPELLVSGNFPKIEKWRKNKHLNTPKTTSRFVGRLKLCCYKTFSIIKFLVLLFTYICSQFRVNLWR